MPMRCQQSARWMRPSCAGFSRMSLEIGVGIDATAPSSPTSCLALNPGELRCFAQPHDSTGSSVSSHRSTGGAYDRRESTEDHQSRSRAARGRSGCRGTTIARHDVRNGSPHHVSSSAPHQRRSHTTSSPEERRLRHLVVSLRLAAHARVRRPFCRWFGSYSVHARTQVRVPLRRERLEQGGGVPLRLRSTHASRHGRRGRPGTPGDRLAPCVPEPAVRAASCSREAVQRQRHERALSET